MNDIPLFKKKLAIARYTGLEPRLTPVGNICMVKRHSNARISSWELFDIVYNKSHRYAILKDSSDAPFMFKVYGVLLSMRIAQEFCADKIISMYYDKIKEVVNGDEEAASEV